MQNPMILLALAAAGIAAPLSARAGGTVSVSSMSVDGLEVRDLSCTTEKAVLLGAIAVVGALAQQKDALQACGPEGAAFGIRFTFAEATTAAVTAASNRRGACVEAAMAKVPVPLVGTCTAVILTGPTDKAEAARAALAPAPAPAEAPKP